MSDRQFEDEEFETSAPRARTASISTMGQLLLQGYAMLADSCQTCGVRFDIVLFTEVIKRKPATGN